MDETWKDQSKIDWNTKRITHSKRVHAQGLQKKRQNKV